MLGGGPVADTRGDRQGGTEAELRGLVDELVGAVSAARQNGIEHFITDEFAFITSGAEVGEAKQLAKAGASNITVAQSRRFLGNEEAKLFTRNLPTVDKVELLKLKKNGDLWNGEIESSKMVEGVEAQKTASLWRTQNYLPDSAICHYPGYAIKFYFKDKLIAYATLCLECNNISFETPNLKRTQGFGGRDKKGQQLLQVFHTAFPEAK